MAAFDPFLYVAFGLGLLLGRLLPHRPGWTSAASMVAVVALLLLLGATFASVPAATLLGALPLGLLFTALVVGFTALVALLIRPPRTAPHPAPPHDHRPFPWAGVFAGAVLVGYFVLGRFALPTGAAIEWALYVLLALVAFDLRLSRRALGAVWVPLTSAFAAGLLAALVMVVAAGLSVPVALATSLAFGWYTLAGPLVAAKAGAALGLVAFLTNFLRENLTMLTAPLTGHRLGGEGIAALGGATSMDTTLYFAVRFGDPDAGSLALATGLILTVSAGVLLPIILSLPGA